ncbi:MAG: quinone-dependent dihydroorotate dehydrogenase [Betaproteobacteria bacterium]|nr:quinone-dependent dihydroorotate dehydrogenase [Betaproteobacteria bacterium]
MNLWPLLRRVLHRVEPERAHDLAMRGLGLVPRLLDPNTLGGARTVMGLEFPNPIGLAAGFDKSGDHFLTLAKLGFGFIEVGTITPRPQPGSPPPRLFRIPEHNALINRMGFNNAGAAHAARRLARRGDWPGVLGINIGRNRDTPADAALGDYLQCMETLYGLADYFTINISSPNTPGLRDLQQPELIGEFLDQIGAANEKLAARHAERMRLVLKVAPELAQDQIEAIAAAVAAAGFDGLIAANTTVVRSAELTACDFGGQPGGVSGAPLTAAAEQAARNWRAALPSSVALIGCGGIGCGEDARARIDAGADLIQLYTGLIYAGPALVAQAAAAITA